MPRQHFYPKHFYRQLNKQYSKTKKQFKQKFVQIHNKNQSSLIIYGKNQHQNQQNNKYHTNIQTKYKQHIPLNQLFYLNVNQRHRRSLTSERTRRSLLLQAQTNRNCVNYSYILKEEELNEQNQKIRQNYQIKHNKYKTIIDIKAKQSINLSNYWFDEVQKKKKEDEDDEEGDYVLKNISNRINIKTGDHKSKTKNSQLNKQNKQNQEVKQIKTHFIHKSHRLSKDQQRKDEQNYNQNKIEYLFSSNNKANPIKLSKTTNRVFPNDDNNSYRRSIERTKRIIQNPSQIIVSSTLLANKINKKNKTNTSSINKKFNKNNNNYQNNYKNQKSLRYQHGYDMRKSSSKQNQVQQISCYKDFQDKQEDFILIQQFSLNRNRNVINNFRKGKELKRYHKGLFKNHLIQQKVKGWDIPAHEDDIVMFL